MLLNNYVRWWEKSDASPIDITQSRSYRIMILRHLSGCIPESNLNPAHLANKIL